MAKLRKPRKLSVVACTEKLPPRRNPFAKDAALIFLGEIPNYRGRCVLLGANTGQLYAFYETTKFQEVTVKRVKR
jgi:hypothetical protein